MSLVTRTYTFTDGTTAYGSQVESEIQNIATVLNGLNAGTTTWDIVKAVNGSSTPLIADNSSGTNTVLEARVNGVTKVSVSSAGVLLTANGITNSGAAIAAGSQKITGLSNGTAATDAAAFGQLIAGNIVGTTTNDSATAGNIGERVSSSLQAQAVGVTSTQFGDFTNISLTAGDWDVSAVLYATIGAGAWQALQLGISTTSGNSTTGLTLGDNRVISSWASSSTTPTEQSLSIPCHRISIASTTIVYLKYSVTYSTGPTLSGRISARRVR